MMQDNLEELLRIINEAYFYPFNCDDINIGDAKKHVYNMLSKAEILISQMKNIISEKEGEEDGNKTGTKNNNEK